MIALLFCSRSRSSMVAGIFAAHGIWGGYRKNKLLPYQTFENQFLREWIREETLMEIPPAFLLPTFQQQRSLAIRIHCLKPPEKWYWKVPIDLHQIIEPFIQHAVCIKRDPVGTAQSIVKRGSRRSYQVAINAVTSRHQMMDSLGYPVIDTDQILNGNFSTLEKAFDHCGHKFSSEITKKVINLP